MLKLDEPLARAIRVTSPTVPDEQVEAMLRTPGAYLPSGHFLYPADEAGKKGNHLTSLFLVEPIAANMQYVEWIVDDIERWQLKEGLTFDLVFAPAQMAVKTIARQIAARLGIRQAYWEYTPGGWFGEKIVEGAVKPGDRVLVFNGVTQQGRCVGERLPSFVEAAGGIVAAAAVFAKGTADGVAAAEKRYGSRFYSMVQVDIVVAAPSACQLCHGASSEPPALIPWTKYRDEIPA